MSSVVTFHTTDPYYAKASEAMAVNCSKLGISLRDFVETSQAGWAEVTRRKPIYVQRAAEGNVPFFWVDVDCEIRRPLDFNGSGGFDLGFVPFIRNGYMGVPIPIRSAVIYFNTTPNARRFIDLWKWCCERFPNQHDHEALVQAWGALQWMPEINYRYLRCEYCATNLVAETTPWDWEHAIVRLGLAKHDRKTIDTERYRRQGAFRHLTLEEYEEWRKGFDSK